MNLHIQYWGRLKMQEFNITVTISKKESTNITVKQGTTLKELAEQFQNKYDVPIVLAKVNNKLQELHNTIEKEGTLAFVTMSDRDGKRTYRRSVTMLLQKAVDNLWSHATVRVLYSLGDGYYCEVEGVELNKEMISASPCARVPSP